MKGAASSPCRRTPPSHTAARTHSTIAAVPQSPSETSIGQTMSQSIRGCSRLPTPYRRERTMLMRYCVLFAHALPQLAKPFRRYRHRRLELLCEQRHPQLFEQPAELLELG